MTDQGEFKSQKSKGKIEIQKLKIIQMFHQATASVIINLQ